MMHTTTDSPWRGRLVKIREQLKLTQARAAELIGVSTRSWVAWERGYRTPTPAAQILIRQLSSRTDGE